ETFSNLDPGNSAGGLDVLQRWRQEGLGGGGGPRTLLLVCHNLRIAFRQERAGRPLADQFLILSERGEVVRGRLIPRAELEAEIRAAGGDFAATLEGVLGAGGAPPALPSPLP